jgi:hypothetical protein
MLACGMAAWPPRPLMRTDHAVEAAKSVPARDASVPVSCPAYGHTCSANMACVALATPASSIAAAPAPPSSAGWKTSSTVPGGKSCCFSSRAAPINIAMWASWPHACERSVPSPGAQGGRGLFHSSRSGSASMSARSAMYGAPCPSVATMPVPARPAVKGMPSSRSASCSRCAVRCSAYFSCACGRVRRLYTGACLHKHVVGKRGRLQRSPPRACCAARGASRPRRPPRQARSPARAARCRRRPAARMSARAHQREGCTAAPPRPPAGCDASWLAQAVCARARSKEKRGAAIIGNL